MFYTKHINSRKKIVIGMKYLFSGDKDALAMDSTVSEGTVETLLTLSPSEPCAELIPCKQILLFI